MSSLYNVTFTFEDEQSAKGFKRGVDWVSNDNIEIIAVRKEGVKWIVYILDQEDDDPMIELPTIKS